MRALFLLVVTFILAAVAWLSVRHADRIYCRMLLNKAVYQFSSHKEEEAIDQAIAILRRKPDYRPALEAAIGWLAGRREFERALALAAEYGTTPTLSPLTRYRLGVCAYECGDEQEAVELFESLESGSDESSDVPYVLVGAYLAAARSDREQARSALESLGPRLQGDPFYHALFGRTCYARANITRALEELSRAVASGERNPRSRLILAICHAMLGRPTAMQRLLDELEAEDADAYVMAHREILQWLERLQSAGHYVSRRQFASRRERIFNLRLGLVTIYERQGHIADALAELDALSRDYPTQLGLATRKGLLFERRKQLDEALECYRREADRLLLAAYKVAMLDAAATTVPAWRDFLPEGAIVFDAGELNPSVGVAAPDRGWNLFASGDFSTTFTIGSTGRYAFNLIARADQAGGIWPIVQVFIDGQLATEQYINSPVWTIFEFEQPLLAGRHSVRLFYVNNALAPGVGGDRNFYLDKLIIRPEAN